MSEALIMKLFPTRPEYCNETLSINKVKENILNKYFRKLITHLETQFQKLLNACD